MRMEELAKNILALETSHSLSKVRFAKTIYFVHKELIRNGLLSKDSIQYIRMPLGPVPMGFMEISSTCPEITAKKEQSGLGLAYATENYSTKAEFSGTAEEKTVIAGTLDTLRKYQTSSLVETSHKDPSWLSHRNSDEYYITDDDMKNDLSILEKFFANSSTAEDEEDKMQANLVRGMLNDIVSESTALEYPS